jgi:hypothetical protein
MPSNPARIADQHDPLLLKPGSGRFRARDGSRPLPHLRALRALRREKACCEHGRARKTEEFAAEAHLFSPIFSPF